ncbi:MAG: hypothetical protein WBF66_11465 [Dehalococcoidia bacterium]
MGLGPFELLLIAWVSLIVWAIWRVCRKADLSGWLVLLVLVPGVGTAFTLLLAWRALPRAGYSRWFVPVVLVPILNIAMFLWLAVRHWPGEPEAPIPVSHESDVRTRRCAETEQGPELQTSPPAETERDAEHRRLRRLGMTEEAARRQAGLG